jgi:hypothetical protein
MKIQHIAIQRIKKPFLYCYHYELRNDVLQKSVNERGIINPLWLVEKRGFHIIDGHRRWQAAKSARISQIPVYIFSESDLIKTFISALHLNLTASNLSMVERLKTVCLAQRYFDESTFNQVSRILELSNFPNFFEISSKIMSLPIWLQSYFHQLNLSLKYIDKIIQYPITHYRQWIKMATVLRFNGMELIQLLENVHDISLQNQIEIYKLWDLLDIDVFLSSDFTVPQKIQHIKKTIEKKRFPILHQINKNIQENINSFPKSFRKFFQISWDKNLEQSGIVISFQMKITNDLRRAASLMSKKEIQGKLHELVKQMEKYPQN